MTDLVTGDTGSKIRVTCTDAATLLPINLAGCTVRLRWEGAAGVVTKTMTVTDAANGVAEYQFGTSEIEAPRMKLEVEVTDNAGKVISNLDLIELEVREQVG